MNLERLRPLTIASLLPLLGAPAAAQFRRSGMLSWRFDDMVVNSGAGRVSDAQWAQDYGLDVDGPAGSAAVGTLHGGFAFSDGASLSQAVTTGIPHRKSLSLSASGDLFSPWVRRYVRFSPNVSTNDLRLDGTANGAPYSSRLTNTGWGFTTGLSLPRLPAVGWSLQANTLNNPSDLNPVQQRSTTESKTLSYNVGHVVLNASQQTVRSEDLLGVVAPLVDDYRTASLEANYYEPKRLNLQYFFYRADFSDNRSNGASTQRQATGNLGLVTRKFRTGLWDSSLTFGESVSRDFLRDARTWVQNGGLNSTRAVRSGTVDNAFLATQSPSAGTWNASDSLSVSRVHARGLVATTFGGSGGLSGGAGQTLAADGLNGRVSLFPGLSRNYFAEARLTETRDPRGLAGSRIARWGLGASSRSETLTTSARFDSTRSRFDSSGLESVSNQLALDASDRPNRKLYLTAGYGLGIVTSGSSKAVSNNLHASADYEPGSGFSFSASGTWIGTGGTVSASGSYTIGKTSLKLSYEYRGVATPSTYTHWSAVLTRAL